jgi:hypothetical protein
VFTRESGEVLRRVPQIIRRVESSLSELFILEAFPVGPEETDADPFLRGTDDPGAGLEKAQAGMLDL